MSYRAGEREIAEYLERVRRLLSEGKYDFVPRRKNMLSLAKYGLTVLDAKSEIIGLNVSDYHKGPKRDFDPDRPGEIWEFKKDIRGIRFYIKLKIVPEDGIEILKCLGFHEDEIE
ncbi:MAG: hypothetical protein ACOYJO_01500 [Eubacterium sp.]|jgi:hypothetical protein